MSQNHRLQPQRFELKYLIPSGLSRPIREFVSSYLELDDYANGQADYAYEIHSVYLDSPDLRAHRATVNGDRNRFKLRLRYYDDRAESPVFLEIKRRADNCILKQRCPVRRESVPSLLAGQLPGREDVLSEEPRHLAAGQRFVELQQQLSASPKLHNHYRREAWVSSQDNSVRVTLDSGIEVEPFFDPRPAGRMTNGTLIYPGLVVLELKFSARFPNWFQQLVDRFDLMRAAAMKYSWGVDQVGEWKFQRGDGAYVPAETRVADVKKKESIHPEAPGIPNPFGAGELAPAPVPAYPPAAATNPIPMNDWFFRGDYGVVPTNYPALALGLLLAFLSGHAVAWVYMLTHTGLSYSRSYVNTLILMPVIVAMVMMILANNLVIAFGLMAIFAMVRFRSVLRDTLDTSYILAVIVIGLACGTLKFSSAIIGCLATLALMLYFWATGFGARQRYDLIVNLQWTLAAAELSDLLGVLNRHSRSVLCASHRAGEGLAAVDLSYRLLLRDPARSHELMDELKSLPGIARASSLASGDESEL